MKHASIHTRLLEQNIKVVLCDYFDTIVHRIVHPNYTQRLWAKILIREFGLKGSVDSLYFTRRESSIYLKKKLGLAEIELPYDALKEEVYRRLENNLLIDSSRRSRFMEYFELADLRSEQTVQYLNRDILDLLNAIKSSGIKIYLVSDFYASESIFRNLLKYHEIENLIDGIYSSAVYNKSKRHGQIFDQIISDLKIDPDQIMMIGDDRISDLESPRSRGIQSTLLPHKKFRLKNKIMSFGNDKKDYSKTINKAVKACRHPQAQPLSEYIIFYQVFIERLYILGRRFKISNFFFVSREGQYLKKLFDAYQDQHFLKESDKIGSHYLRMSRQAAFQISYDSLEKESFTYLRKRFKNLSLKKFLNNFAFSEGTTELILSKCEPFSSDKEIEDFFDSPEFSQLKALPEFVEAYDINRMEQRQAFLKYLASYNVDYKNEGIHVVDVGWGGTMQEAIFKVFEETIPVTGFYLGLRETYNIQEMTKRYGLLFSVHPYEVYSDHILTANTQLYEQLLSANHGSTLGYDASLENFAIENYTDSEKILFENIIRPHQEFMFNRYKILLNDLDLICYDYNIVQNKITDLAMRNGLFLNTKKLKFIASLSKGFYQNVGDNKVGVNYEVSQLGNKRTFIKDFLIQPESKFRFLVKLKPVLFEKGSVLTHIIPMRLVYWYFLFNRYVREKILKRRFFLKYNYFR